MKHVWRPGWTGAKRVRFAGNDWARAEASFEPHRSAVYVLRLFSSYFSLLRLLYMDSFCSCYSFTFLFLIFVFQFTYNTTAHGAAKWGGRGEETYIAHLDFERSHFILFLISFIC